MTKVKIFTWNYGKSTLEKLQCISSKLDLNAQDTIYIVGLQEVSTFDILTINNHITNATTGKNYTVTYGRKSSTTMGFDLLTFIIYPTILNINIKKNNLGFISRTKAVASTSKSFIGDTKGYLWIDFSINNIDITVVNIHLPFQNAAFSYVNFKMLFDTFNTTKNAIIFGDYNTRSTVDDTCLNDASSCSVVFEKNAKGEVNALQGQLNSCKVQTDCESLKQKLISNDYLNQVIKTEMKGYGYNEAQINFLPSYKINNSGNYSLQKNEDRRLVGYADRILVKGVNLNIIPDSYKLMECLGNDHFPLMLDVEITSVVQLQPVIEPVIEPVMPSNPHSGGIKRSRRNKTGKRGKRGKRGKTVKRCKKCKK